MRLKPISCKDIKINDKFWFKHIDLVEKVIIPYQWDIMNDRIPGVKSSHCLENFKIAAGWKEGEFYGAVFQDTDIAKWLEAVGYFLSWRKNLKWEKLADEVIDLLAAAQQPDGYLDTYFIVKAPDKKWKNLCEGHELYTAGHMMEAAVAYYIGTGKRKFLDCMLRLADLICETFGQEEGKNHGYPGHQEVEIGLIKLYQITGKKKYLDQAKYFLDVRGVGDNYFLQEQQTKEYMNLFPEFKRYDPKYSQSHLPVREQETAEGHAVRAVYMYCAMADIAAEYQDQTMLSACKKIWTNIVEKRMYITGGIGSSGILERFTTDYDLPNDYNYSETCASIGLAMFGIRMANITKDSKYADVVELALYNNILAGISLDGRRFFYVNPLEVIPQNCMDHTSKEHVKAERQKWFGVACCPPNVARTLASMGQYIYGKENDRLYVHLFISNETCVSFQNQKVSIALETKFPWESSVNISFRNVPTAGFEVAVRIPEYVREYKIFSGNKEIPYEVKKGYAIIKIEEDMDIRITFTVISQFIRAHIMVSQDVGKVALKRGPIVYCLEEIDNGENLSAVFLDTSSHILEEEKEEFGGIIALKVKGKRMRHHSSENLYEAYTPEFEPTLVTAIPYAYWNNRGTGEMAVWIKALI